MVIKTTTIRFSWLPKICFMFIPMSFFITYAISVLSKRISPLFPMISDTGTFEPASYVFGALLDIGSLVYLIAGLFAFRIQQLEFVHPVASSSSSIIKYRFYFVKYINYFVPLSMLVSCIGGIAVAHIQVTQNPIVHFISSLVCFGGAMAYIVLMTTICWIKPISVCRLVRIARLVLSILTALCFAGFLTHLHFIIKYGIHESNIESTSFWIARYHIDVSDANPHANTIIAALSLGAVCEWLMVFCYGLFMLSIGIEFDHVNIRMPSIDMNNDQEQQQTVKY